MDSHGVGVGRSVMAVQKCTLQASVTSREQSQPYIAQMIRWRLVASLAVEIHATQGRR